MESFVIETKFILIQHLEDLWVLLQFQTQQMQRKTHKSFSLYLFPPRGTETNTPQLHAILQTELYTLNFSVKLH